MKIIHEKILRRLMSCHLTFISTTKVLNKMSSSVVMETFETGLSKDLIFSTL